MSRTGNWVMDLQEQGLYDYDYSYNDDTSDEEDEQEPENV